MKSNFTFDAVEIATKSWKDAFLYKSHSWVCLVFCSALTTGLSSSERFIASNERSSFGENRYTENIRKLKCVHHHYKCACIILTLCIAGVEFTLSKSKLLRSVKLPFIDIFVLSTQLRLWDNTGPVSAKKNKIQIINQTVLVR